MDNLDDTFPIGHTRHRTNTKENTHKQTYKETLNTGISEGAPKGIAVPTSLGIPYI